MTNQRPSVADIFKYVPDAVILKGFPKCRLLDEMGVFFGSQPGFRRYREDHYGRAVTYPSFPLKYLMQREDFFQRLPNHFEIGKIDFPKRGDMGDSNRSLRAFCRRTYEAIDSIVAHLSECKNMPEAQRVLERTSLFDKDLKEVLEALRSVETSTTFAIDSNTGIMVPIQRMPPYDRCLYGEDSWSSYELKQEMTKAHAAIGEAAIRIAKRGVRGFRDRIMNFVDEEFSYGHADNWRKAFEQFALPVRLNAWYHHFLDEARQNMPFDLEEAVKKQGQRYPETGDHYEIMGLYPPTLLGYRNRAVPIDFFSKKEERKFLIAGLHSGSKSFHLKNLALLSILAQTPVAVFADSVVIPAYEKIFYYQNEDVGKREGKALTGVKDLIEILEQCGERDVLFLDEFSDSMDQDVAEWIVPELLGKADKTGATLFVVSHRVHDYRRLRKQGWVIMTPEHKIEKGRVEPTKRIVRGVPDSGINARYVRERYLKMVKGR